MDLKHLGVLAKTLRFLAQSNKKSQTSLAGCFRKSNMKLVVKFQTIIDYI